jgi:hypothetical protein
VRRAQGLQLFVRFAIRPDEIVSNRNENMKKKRTWRYNRTTTAALFL